MGRDKIAIFAVKPILHSQYAKKIRDLIDTYKWAGNKTEGATSQPPSAGRGMFGQRGVAFSNTRRQLAPPRCSDFWPFKPQICQFQDTSARCAADRPDAGDIMWMSPSARQQHTKYQATLIVIDYNSPATESSGVKVSRLRVTR